MAIGKVSPPPEPRSSMVLVLVLAQGGWGYRKNGLHLPFRPVVQAQTSLALSGVALRCVALRCVGQRRAKSESWPLTDWPTDYPRESFNRETGI